MVTAPPTALLGILRQLQADPDKLLKEQAERSLWEFTRQLWRQVVPATFRDNWHLGAVCEHLEAVTSGEIRRLVINIPPRHSKSTVVSVMWPAWIWAQPPRRHAPLAGPQVRIMAASYAQQLSVRDSVNCRRVIQSGLYQGRWGDRFQLTSDQNTKIRFENKQGGYRLATSVDGALTGEGGDVILIDDPHNVTEATSELERESVLEWWDQSMSTRLNDVTTGAYVMIMQRVHHEDLAGHVLEEDGWTHLCLPARYEPDHPAAPQPADKRTHEGELLWPAGMPEAELRLIESRLGPYGSAGQLQQRPSPRTGGMFARDKWKYLDAIPPGGRWVRGWDLASTTRKKSPYTVGVLMGLVDGRYIVADVVRFRGETFERDDAIKATAVRDGPGVIQDIPQDPASGGKSQVEYLVRQLAGFNVQYSTENKDKTVRAEAFSAQQGGGNAYLVRSDSWNRAYVEEAALFPTSDYKDQIDASSRGFHRLTPLDHVRGFAEAVHY